MYQMHDSFYRWKHQKVPLKLQDFLLIDILQEDINKAIVGALNYKC